MDAICGISLDHNAKLLFYLSSLRDQDQNKILHKINEVISKSNVTNEKHCSLMLAYWLLITDNAPWLYIKYEYEYILTRRLN